MTVKTAPRSHERTPDPPQENSAPRGSAVWRAVRRSHTAWVVSMVVLLSLLPRLLTAGRFTTIDEPLWRRRSSNFVDALGSGSFGDASAISSEDGGTATMPGVTTMWIGSFARGVWSSGRAQGRWPDDVAFAGSPSGLAIAQASMALVTSVLIGLVTFLVVRWAGSLAAGAIAGVLLATEPYLVTLGAVLHTDELMSLLGVAALLATALVLGLPQPRAWQGRWWAAALAGGLFGGALLTKLSALPFLVGVGAMGIWALGRHFKAHRSHGEDDNPSAPDDRPSHLDARAVAKLGAIWVVAATAVFVVSYPALWAQPLQEIENLRRSAALAGEGHSQFFLGERTGTPGPAYLFVTLPLRATPWFLIAGLAAGVVVLWQRWLRAYGLLALCMALPTFAVVSLASKQSIRYALPVPIVGAIVIGIVGAAVMSRLASKAGPKSLVTWLSTAAVAFVTIHSVVVAPLGNAYFNPVLGGGSAAERAHLVGSGEGLEQAGDFIQDREAPNCNGVVIWSYPVGDAFPCGRVTDQKDNHRQFDYVVLYINQRQREEPDFLEELTGNRELLGEITVRGILYAEIFGPSAPQAAS